MLNIVGKCIGFVEYEFIFVKYNDVIEVVVIGVFDEVKGEVCYCFVVLRDYVIFIGELKKELMSLVNFYIGKVLCFKDIYVVEDLLKICNFKVMCCVIKVVYLGKELGDLLLFVNFEVVLFI